ncbi:hypothetical protein DY000_02047549 [Brassica cretica]|uniref:Uncharacterized protein n=1 Tax=Brassica cretica TaxID=69181 RepID=A0ABQ7F9V3_BRACR|nr:hypothetical protein DY000_02047549 [Brassica cretica]
MRMHDYGLIRLALGGIGQDRPKSNSRSNSPLGELDYFRPTLPMASWIDSRFVQLAQWRNGFSGTFRVGYPYGELDSRQLAVMASWLAGYRSNSAYSELACRLTGHMALFLRSSELASGIDGSFPSFSFPQLIAS